MSRNHAQLNACRWATLRRSVFERDGWRCVRCGRAGRLECDHIDRDWRGDPYDPANLQTLCRCCHIEKTAAENRRPLTPAEAAWRDLVAEMASKIDKIGDL